MYQTLWQKPTPLEEIKQPNPCKPSIAPRGGHTTSFQRRGREAPKGRRLGVSCPVEFVAQVYSPQVPILLIDIYKAVTYCVGTWALGVEYEPLNLYNPLQWLR